MDSIGPAITALCEALSRPDRMDILKKRIRDLIFSVQRLDHRRHLETVLIEIEEYKDSKEELKRIDDEFMGWIDRNFPVNRKHHR
ncbi:MAG: hypothetical protein MPW15_12365 [Candidatus Manganitrophus sp.]|nr:hypothetical protein [Candidatus Manganitrophus sp.]MDC4224987.1 hypothetical protein [Candidatus Manganitrophus sp.]